MPRWKELPEELDPQVREFTWHLQRLVERSGLSVDAVADRTGYSRSSWERYLNGRLLPPQDAVIALAEVTRTQPGHLTTMWEMAERAWNRTGLRPDEAVEAIQGAALGEFGPPEDHGRGSGGRRGMRGYFGFRGRTAEEPPPAEPQPPAGAAQEQAQPSQAEVRPQAAPQRPQPQPQPQAPQPQAPQPQPQPPRPSPPTPAPSPPEKRWPARRVLLALLVTVLLGSSVAGAAWVGHGLLTGPDDGGQTQGDQSNSSDASPSVSLPEGVKCVGEGCAGKDPEAMGCGGEYASTTADAYVGNAYVEVRVSSACNAAWARITDAAQGSTVTAIGEPPGKRAISEEDDAGSSSEGYTPMVVVEDLKSVRACAELPNGTAGCTSGQPLGQ